MLWGVVDARSTSLGYEPSLTPFGNYRVLYHELELVGLSLDCCGVLWMHGELHWVHSEFICQESLER